MVSAFQADVGRRCLHYLGMFRGGGRGLSWPRVLRLLTEIRALLDAATVAWDGKPARPCTASMWGQAMEKMIQNPPRSLPLKNHNYLRAIAYEIANDGDRAAEVKRNKAERAGTLRPDRPATYPDVPERIDFEEMRRITDERYRKRKK